MKVLEAQSAARDGGPAISKSRHPRAESRDQCLPPPSPLYHLQVQDPGRPGSTRVMGGRGGSDPGRLGTPTGDRVGSGRPGSTRVGSTRCHLYAQLPSSAMVLLKLSLCALLLTFRSGVLVAACEHDDDDAWAEAVTFFDFDAFDAHNLAGAGGAAILDQPASSFPRMDDPRPDPNFSYAADHPGADGPCGQSGPSDARTLGLCPSDDRVDLGNGHQATSLSPLSGNVNSLQCQYCGTTFSTRHSRVSHETHSCIASEPIPGTKLVIEAGRLAVQCLACRHGFRSRYGFRQHQASNPECGTGCAPSAVIHGNQCRHCQIMLVNPAKRRGHEKRCESLKLNRLGYQCQSCHMVFASKAGLRGHLSECPGCAISQRPAVTAMGTSFQYLVCQDPLVFETPDLNQQPSALSVEMMCPICRLPVTHMNANDLRIHLRDDHRLTAEEVDQQYYFRSS